MAPKAKTTSKKSTSLLNSIKSSFLQSTSTLNLTSINQLSSAILYHAYGLSSPSTSLIKCPSKSSTTTSDQPSTEVIVIDSSASDDDKPVLSKDKGKGKAKGKTYGGKGKGKQIDLPHNPVCGKDNCVNNPTCLNWLSQDKWEDTGLSLAF